MLNLSHGARELAKRVSNHLGDNFDAIELVTVMDGDGEVDHFGENDHVTAVGFDNDVFPLLHLLPGSSEVHQELLLSWGKASLEGSSPA